MKRKEIIEVLQCDFCNIDSNGHILCECSNCHKDICFVHTHSVSIDSQKVYLCPECLDTLLLKDIRGLVSNNESGI